MGEAAFRTLHKSGKFQDCRTDIKGTSLMIVPFMFGEKISVYSCGVNPIIGIILQLMPRDFHAI